MQTLNQSSSIENITKMTISLRSTIENAINKNIPKDDLVINGKYDDQKS